MQRPHIVRMLSAALNFPGQTQIVAIDFFRFFTEPLLKKEGGQRVAGRVHPGPRLDVLEIVVATNTFSQTLERALVITLMVLQFAIEHLLA